MDGIYLRRNWGGEYENVCILVAIAVNEDGYREMLGAAEGLKEDKSSWTEFFRWLRGRGLDGVKLVVGDKCLGMLEAAGEVFPEAKYQRCTVHFYRNVFPVVPRSKVKLVAKMLKAIHAQESKAAAREKANAVVTALRERELKEAAKKVEDSVEKAAMAVSLAPVIISSPPLVDNAMLRWTRSLIFRLEYRYLKVGLVIITIGRADGLQGPLGPIISRAYRPIEITLCHAWAIIYLSLAWHTLSQLK